MHPLDESLVLHPADAAATGATAAFFCRSSEHYRNSIGPFGGWIAALLLKGVLSAPQARGAPLALDAIFMGGMDLTDLDLRVLVLRQNRSVGFWRSEIWQRGRLTAQAQVTLSEERFGLVLQDAHFPEVPEHDSVPVYVNPRVPVPWLDQYIFKPVSGFLFTRAPSMDAQLWIRDGSPRQLDAVSLTALCDTPFPPTWIRLAEQAPVSTVTYSIYYRAGRGEFEAAGANFCLLDTRASLARAGYVDQYTSVWSASRTLLAQTQQMLWFSDRPAHNG